ncbi:deoxyhypusine synthase [Candidatus Bathyarchaeota archaeon]|nr:deoxyhypusine synthase [Candidatus Bathyarchaeota archaeon]
MVHVTGDNPKHVDQVKVTPGDGIAKLVSKLGGTGFNAKRVAEACEVLHDMVCDADCTKIMTLAGAMVPAGMRAIISDFISNGFVDVLVTTGANLTHDVIEALGCHHLQGSQAADDRSLLEHGTNRIYDVFMPNESYETLEDFIQDLIFDKEMPLVDFLDFLGREMERLAPGNVQDSIIRNCHLKGVPIFCPAFTDCGLGVQLMLNHRGLKLDMFHDLDRFITMAWDMENVGVFIVGGGVPKNFTFQALQFSPNSATRAVQVTMDRPEPGGLSGASLDEAISWGKVNPDAAHVTVVCDATIFLPLALAYLLDLQDGSMDGE